jgi:hypothetical protein
MRFGSRRDNGVQAATQFTLSLKRTNSASSIVPLDSKLLFLVICETESLQIKKFYLKTVYITSIYGISRISISQNLIFSKKCLYITVYF